MRADFLTLGKPYLLFTQFFFLQFIAPIQQNQRFTMFKKLSSLVVILLLISCQNKIKNSTSSEDVKTEEQTKIEEQQEPYQTVESEDQAVELDAQTKIEAEEIEVQDRVLFGYDSAELTEESRKILDTQTEWLKSDTSIKITIEGHCDERGTREYNIALGEKRANATKSYLTSNGIEESRISVISYGKERPAFFGNNEESSTKNRRAVTVVN